MRAPERGFTLIELIVGIVLLAVALTGILGLLINQAPQAAGADSALGVTIGTGIGGAVYLAGKLIQGRNWLAPAPAGC